MIARYPRLLILLAALVPAPPQALGAEAPEDAHPTHGVKFDRDTGQLSIQAGEKPLATMLEEISAAAGVEFIHSGLEDDSVQVDLRNVPLVEALKELLSHRSYLIQLDPATRRPARVWVMARKSRPAGSFDRQVRRIEPVPPDHTDIAEETAQLLERIDTDEYTEADVERIILSVIEGEEPDLIEELISNPELTRDAGSQR